MSRGALRLAWRLLRREARAGELRIVALATLIAVAATGSVGLLTDRLRAAMHNQAGELLAADLVVQRAGAIPETWVEHARALGLRTGELREFRSMVLAGESMLLAEVKAVDGTYPLRGQLRAVGDAVPGLRPGEVWAAPELARGLGIAPGATLELGATQPRLAALIAHEPDRGGELFSIAPRLLMHLDDLPATQLVQTGSRVDHRLLLAGPPALVAEFRGWLEPRLAMGDRVLGVSDARPEVRAALDRAERFLNLAALVSLILAGVAVAMAARRYARRQLDAAAVLRCLGASNGLLLGVPLLQLAVLGLAGAVAGAALAWLVQAALAALLTTLVGGPLPPAAPWPLLQAAAAGAIMLFGFALPPLLVLRRVPPLRVLRRDLDPRPVSRGLLTGAAAGAVVLLLMWQVRDPELIAWVALGTLAALLVLAGSAWLLVRALRHLRGGAGLAWRFGLANLGRRAGASVVQVTALGVGITVLLLLALVRGDLLEAWAERLPPGTPNRFVINIQPEQVGAVQAFLAERGVAEAPLYPMVRGRLVAINDTPVRPDGYAEPRAQRLVQREFNLSWAADLKPDNRIVAGRWWGQAEHGQALLSVEAELAETLGIGLGDTLSFRVAERQVTARVDSLRAVDWDSFQANFFVLAAPGVLDDLPASWITSFYVGPGQVDLVAALVRAYPNLTVLDVGAVLEQVRGIVEKVSHAVELVFVFTLLAGLVVLYAAVQASQEERIREGAVLRALGASHALVRRAWRAEFLVLGGLAGLLAALLASLIGWVLAEQVFNLSYRPNPQVWWVGLAGGALGTLVVGLYGTRHVLRRPPLEVLRASE